MLRPKAPGWPLVVLVICVASSLGGCVGPSRATAADVGPDPYAGLRAQADDYFRQGQDLYREGQFRRALEAFQQARLRDPKVRPEIDEMIRRSQEALASNRLGPVATNTVETARSGATPGAPAKAIPAGQRFTSHVYTYSVVQPSGWRAEGATVRAGSTLLDNYAEENGPGSAFVFSFVPPDGASQDALIRHSLLLRDKAGTPYKRLGVRLVDDSQAITVTYSEQRSDGVWLAVRQAVFLRGGLGWVVGVAAPQTDAIRYDGILDQLLDGFRHLAR